MVSLTHQTPPEAIKQYNLKADIFTFIPKYPYDNVAISVKRIDTYRLLAFIPSWSACFFQPDLSALGPINDDGGLYR